MLQKYLKEKFKKMDLNKQYEFHAERLKDLTKIFKEEIKTEEQGMEKNLNSEIFDQEYVSLQKINQTVREIELKVKEVLSKQELAASANQQSFKAMGIYSNLGSIATSHYDGNGMESCEKSKDNEGSNEESENLKKEIVLVSEKIDNLKNELKPHMNAISKFMDKNQLIFEQKLAKFLVEMNQKMSEGEIGSEITKVVKEDFKKIVEEVIHSRSNSISERFSLGSSNTHPATVVVQKSTSSAVYSDRARIRNYMQKNSDYYHIMQFLFKTSSMFINTIADLIKDNRNYSSLKEEIIK